MSEFNFGVTYQRPTKREADRWDRICREEGGSGFTWVNWREGTCPGVNGGRFQGWFAAPNKGDPFDSQLAARVLLRINAEAK